VIACFGWVGCKNAPICAALVSKIGETQLPPMPLCAPCLKYFADNTAGVPVKIAYGQEAEDVFAVLEARSLSAGRPS
jgi:hypothetical protein